jgi:hypothetical protein
MPLYNIFKENMSSIIQGNFGQTLGGNFAPHAPAHSTISSTSSHHGRRMGTETANPKGTLSQYTLQYAVYLSSIIFN